MILTDIILIIITLIALIFATIVDIKIKEVPDWISYSLIIIGLSIRLMHSIIFVDWPYFLYGLAGLASTFIVGNILYHTNQWGGGDAKLLMGLGTMLATKPFYLPESRFPFLLILFVYILIAGAIYSVAWSISLISKNIQAFKSEFKSLINYKKNQTIMNLSIIASIIFFILSFMTKSSTLKLVLLFLAILSAGYFYLFSAIKAVENLYFFKKIPVHKLVEGDWLAKDVKLRNKTILSKRTTIDKKHIAELKNLRIREVLIKEGIPFVPPFLIGTVLALTLGNIFL